ncbi:MAG: hypothetical protein ABH825_02665, partial [Candidatus Omnitrophota bacterium]
PSVFKNSRYSIFDYRKGAPPLLALAQGFIIRKDVFLSMPEPDGYDLVPIMALIKEGAPLAYVDSARLYHYQVMSLAAFIRKFRWRIRGNLRSGFQDRKLALMSPASRLKNRIRQYLWVAYSASIILPFIVSAVRCAKKRRLFYMYHFICNTVLIILMARELMGRKPEGTYK